MGFASETSAIVNWLLCKHLQMLWARFHAHHVELSPMASQQKLLGLSLHDVSLCPAQLQRCTELGHKPVSQPSIPSSSDSQASTCCAEA